MMEFDVTPPDCTRASLFVRLKQDGPVRDAAWVEFHSLYAPIIGGFARRMGARPQDVEDVVQEVLKSFLCVAPEFAYSPDRGKFRGYLKTCVWNKLGELRRRRGPSLSGLERFDVASADDVAVEAIWNDVWETEQLGQALAAVREQYSVNEERRRTFRAFEMCTLLDRPTEQVAQELGLSLESVRAAKSRVSKALRQAFERLRAMMA